GQVTAPPPVQEAASVAQEAPAAAAAAAQGAESVTNVQHAGVDEGGIVKVHGDYLVILRRGRLFTVRIGGNALEPVSAVDAFGPDINPSSSWFDELLVSGDQVVVIGYSYERGGTELGIFRIDPAGRLTHRATYQLISGDYYSSRNYASRLIGTRLIFYAPIWADAEAEDPLESFPAMRRWSGPESEWRRTAAATRVYRPAGRVSLYDELTLHTVTVCELAGEEMECQATALYGPEGRVFYVSPTSVYVWTTQYPDWNEEEEDDAPRSVLYRMPLDGSAPTGLRVSGAPVDQLSFLESGDGHLNVLVAAEGAGEGMWGAERATGDLALLRLPLTALGDGSRAARNERYRDLPTPQGDGSLQNRYVGEWLLYGQGTGWGSPQSGRTQLFGVRWADTTPVTELRPPHSVDRIEAMGSGAVVIGTDGRDLHFSGVRLGPTARLAQRYTRAGASQGETRTHGFFYRPDAQDAGVLGLPIRGGDRPGYEQLRLGSASILFLRNRDFDLTEMGELAAGDPRQADDGCRASCVDWYGNARPLFLRGRILALMGYELVEGAEDDGRLRELRRVNFGPNLTRLGIDGDWAYEEEVGIGNSRYNCRSRGTFRFDVQGDSLAVGFRQDGTCTTDGRTGSSAGQGSGAGTVGAMTVWFTVDTCRYTGSLQSASHIVGTMQCIITLPGGPTTDIHGRWEARRG
ncbi:MAG TPA: beta-propeller domain-containing protein, partial [Longimicrobium sp.]|nr:beta-propeller domain-containing protein [Longimicrobium sp.]